MVLKKGLTISIITGLIISIVASLSLPVSYTHLTLPRLRAVVGMSEELPIFLYLTMHFAASSASTLVFKDVIEAFNRMVVLFSALTLVSKDAILASSSRSKSVLFIGVPEVPYTTARL